MLPLLWIFSCSLESVRPTGSVGVRRGFDNVAAAAALPDAALLEPSSGHAATRVRAARTRADRNHACSGSNLGLAERCGRPEAEPLEPPCERLLGRAELVR